jgi:hypothetical protein
MARSSVETEYRAIASTTSELMWIKQVFIDINIKVVEPMKIFCDNQSARHIATNLVFYERTKHIELTLTLLKKKCNQRRLRLHLLRAKTNWLTFSQKD